MDLYEYGFRWYDAATGRFIGVDPIADEFAWVNTYNYAENEPVGHIDLHGLQKYKPKIQPIEGPKDLFSTKMLNNLWEGTKTITREFFTKDIGTVFKTTGSSLEYGGIAAGMAGQAEVSVPAVVMGKTLDVVGTGIIVVDELIESRSVSPETAVEITADIVFQMLPEPLEKGIDNLGLDNVATSIIKSQRDGMLKATQDVTKNGLKEMVKKDDQKQVAENQNCSRECNE